MHVRFYALLALLLPLTVAWWQPAVGQVASQAVPVEPNTDVTFKQRLTLQDATLNSAQPIGNLTCNYAATNCNISGVRRVVLKLKLSLGDEYNYGSNAFNAGLNVSMQGQTSSGPASGVTASATLQINQAAPEHTYTLDITSMVAAAGTALQQLRISASNYTRSFTQSYQPVVLTATLEETYTMGLVSVGLPSTSQTQSDGKLDHLFTWNDPCACSKTHQVQIIKITALDPAALSDATWNLRGIMLDAEGSNQLRTALPQGLGQYKWRVRAISNANDKGAALPTNIGPWSAVATLTVTEPTVMQAPGQLEAPLPPSLYASNWMYSRTFSEGGRVAEKMTFATGLMHTRQILTRLGTNRQVVGVQTLQDFTGRNALQSLPIPIVGDQELNYKPNLLRKVNANVAYSADDFDDFAYGASARPNAALEKGYYSSSATAINLGVADAQNYPFSRTLFAADGSSRVREQGAAGTVLGLGMLTSVNGEDVTHTVRTFYSSVAQQELTELFGKEAPDAASVYKIITTDPNNTTTVAYHTQDEQVIATALSGSSGIPTLEPVLSTDPNKSVQASVNNNVPYQNVGSSSSKILVMPAPGPVTFIYKLQPQTFADACGKICSTCDYALLISARNVDTGDTVLIKSRVQPNMGVCGNTVAWPTNSASFTRTRTLQSAGTWIIEKRVTAYNLAAGSTTQLLIDQKTAELRTEYEKERTDDTGRWYRIQQYINDAQPLELYSYLESEGFSPTTIDGREVYLIPFGCAGNTIEIPVLNMTSCEPAPTCNPDRPGFEEYVELHWRDLAIPVGGRLPYALLYQPGEVDELIQNMMTDPDYPRVDLMGPDWCRRMWDCWKGAVEDYVVQVQAGASPSSINLIQNFLDCTGVWMTKVVASNAQLDIKRVYQQFVYDGNNVQHRDCLSGITTSNDPNQLQTSPVQEFNQLYACIRGGQTTSGSAPVLSQQAYAQAVRQCKRSCEDRRSEFRQAIMNRMRREGRYTYLDAHQLAFDNELNTYVPVSEQGLPDGVEVTSACEIDLMTEELVQQCVSDCEPVEPDLNASTPPNLSPEQLEQIQKAILFQPDVAIRKYGTSECPAPDVEPHEPGFGPVKEIETSLQIARPTRCANDLLSFVDELTRKVNTRGPNAPAIPCLTGADVQEGVSQSNPAHAIFTYIGPLSKDCSRQINDACSTDYIDRRYYWVSVVDNRHKPEERDLFRVIWNSYIEEEDKDADGNPLMSYVHSLNYEECVAEGVDYYRVPRLVRNTCNTMREYAIRFWEIDAQGQRVGVGSNYGLLKSEFVTISAPYVATNFGTQANFGDANLTDNVYVDILLTSGRMVQAEIEIVPQGTATLASVKPYLRWKEFISCNVKERTLSTCFRWIPRKEIVVGPNDAPDPLTCQQQLAGQLNSTISTQQQTWIDNQLAAYRAQYASRCATPANLHDDLKLQYTLGYHQFTLYYYDHAGNLVKTVPPKGVSPVAINTTANSWLDYSNKDNWGIPGHTLATTYKYNSFKQLLSQKTPDGGVTRFYYNRIGQLRFSINEKQLADHKYSFTRYDDLGRVITAGESGFEFITNPVNAASEEQMIEAMDNAMANVVRTGLISPGYPFAQVSQQVSTYYSVPPPPTQSVTYLNQQSTSSNITTPRFLTNRVSYTLAENTGNQSVWTYYSYDAHGNVEWLAQDIPGLPRKFVRYQYDLISNKVTQVSYNATFDDQFYQRYQYDADNRLVGVLSSTDGSNWEQDARYEYYAHGPLRRLLLGNDQVQGLDYTYTLQGWLKAINHPSLQRVYDPSQDGAAATNAAYDAFGMALSYFDKDYVRTGAPLSAFAADGTPQATNRIMPAAANRNLFNGNIAAWTSQTMHMLDDGNPAADVVGEQYTYDQLNRLKSSQESSYYGGIGGTWSATGKYQTSYSYDANGNLMNLQRTAGDDGQVMDNLSYTYQPSSNRLSHVDDAVLPGTYTDDVDDQAAGNYDYDPVGNLRQDNSAGATMTWTAAGKLASVTRVVNGSAQTVSYLYDATGNRVGKTLTPASGLAQHTRYVRDAGGQLLAVYQGTGNATPTLQEQPLYGSARLGERRPTAPLVGDLALASAYATRELGLKRYELSDHLGNVRAVVTDLKEALLDGTGTPTVFLPTLDGYFNYYPFGQLQPQRYAPGNPTLSGGYRYGYNGKELDNNGELGLTNYDYGFRIYNPGIARFLSVDPLTQHYPSWSPYPFAMNRPIDGIDLEGKEWSSSGKVWNGSITNPEYSIKYQVCISVTNSAKKISESQLNNYLVRLKYQTEAKLKSGSGTWEDPKISVEINFTTDKGSYTLDLRSVRLADPSGVTEIDGNTQKNSIWVAVAMGGYNRNVILVARTLAHELLHTAGLSHIWSKKNKVLDSRQMGPVYPEAIKKNLMNSGANPVEKQADDSGANLTPGQRQALEDQVQTDQLKSKKGGKDAN